MQNKQYPFLSPHPPENKMPQSKKKLQKTQTALNTWTVFFENHSILKQKSKGNPRNLYLAVWISCTSKIYAYRRMTSLATYSDIWDFCMETTVYVVILRKSSPMIYFSREYIA